LRTTKWHWCRSHARSHPYPPIRIAATSIDAIGKLGHAIFDASIAPRGGTLHDGKYAVLVPQEMIASTPRTAAAAARDGGLGLLSRLVREAQRERAGSIEPAARASGGPDRDRDAQPSGAEERHVGRSGGELIAVIRAIENDPDVGAVVLVGAGAGFCAGSGLGGLAAMDTAARRGFEAASGRVARMIAQSRQSRHFGSVLTTSGLPPTPDMAPHCAN
jgi:hypothetical protein